MQPIILAAGDATRLPNKALLPIARNRIAIESAIEFADCAPIIVDSPSSIVSKVLEARGHSFYRVVQPEPLGVPDAIARGAAASHDDYILVLFCDNIYDGVIAHPMKPGVTTMNIANDSLDGWDGSKWIQRSRGTRQRIAGYYYLYRDMAMLGTPGETSVDFLNRIGAKPVPLRCDSWYDIGTVTSYKEYIDAIHQSR